MGLVPVSHRRSGLRALLALTGMAAGFLCAASTLGCVDATISLLAILVLLRAVRRPQRVHLTTAALLTLVTGILLWANLRPTGWQREFGLGTPAELDPIAAAMFWRGWPLSPCMVCLVHGMRFHPGGSPWVALVFDGVLFVVALFAAKAICECCLRWRDGRMRAEAGPRGNAAPQGR